MLVYHYDAQTREFVSESPARVLPGREYLDDFDISKWQIPANSTTISPPNIQSGAARLFDSASESWMFVEDHRGEEWFTVDGDYVIVSELGDPSSFVAPLSQVKPTPTKVQLKEYLADLRWRAETGGVTFNSMPLRTDDRAKTLINAAAATFGDLDTFKFKTPAGWIDVSGVTVRSMRDAIAAHVQACFDVESDADASIDNGTYTTTEDLDSIVWPS